MIQQSKNKTSELLNELEELQSFQQLDLHADIIRGAYSVGFSNPASIQKKAIPFILEGLDLIAQSEAGSGKTAAYAMGMLNQINCQKDQIQAIIVTPVRQLAFSVARFIGQIGQYCKVRTQCCVGGTPMKDQRFQIKKVKPHVIVGTPGRILDHIQKNSFKTDFIKIVVLDEADELLSRNFEEQIIELFKNIVESAQICLFSATYTPQVLAITEKFMKDPVKITLKPYEVPVGAIKQYHLPFEAEEQKLSTLKKLCHSLIIQQWIIFTKTNQKSNQVGQYLKDLGIPTSIIHSEVDDRFQVLSKFKSGQTRILVCTDVMGRGIDISSVSMVINYDMPNPKAALTQYIHRIGRCGRFGRAGVAISFVLKEDEEMLQKIRRLYKISIDILPDQPKDIAPWLATD